MGPHSWGIHWRNVSLASLQLLKSYNLSTMIGGIEKQLHKELEPLKDEPNVQDVHVLGAIHVVKMKEPMDMSIVQPALVKEGFWLQPFGRLLYTCHPLSFKSTG